MTGDQQRGGPVHGFKPLNLPENFGRQFLITVDTEEEFDWSAPFQRTGHTTISVPKLERYQKFVEKLDVKPVYFIDYSIVSDDAAVSFLRDAMARGKATVGVHMHPWVNPPFEEEINDFNSYAGNLPIELERAKLIALRDLIADRLAFTPTLYRAGRYGIGRNTAVLLKELGFKADFSIRPRFDYRGDGGPNFSPYDSRPFWIDRDAGLAEIPLTTLYAGLLRSLGPALAQPMNNSALLSALLAKSGLLQRVPLTPEGVNAAEAREAIDIALDDGLQLLVFSFHSPSLSAGHTPYVTDAADLDAFYDWWRIILKHLQSHHVRPADADAIVGMLSAANL